ncbi:MAG TPA: hypothetical protein VMU33_00950 [Burkholderiaceae bacterium]|nr:hypothetical protein [Burkholderiaceae bacterium]
MPELTFECPIVGKIVTFSTIERVVHPGLPPVQQYKYCTSIESCGIADRFFFGGGSIDWARCPMYSRLK